MTVQQPPMFLAGAFNHSAQQTRRAIASLLTSEGVLATGDLAVTALGTPAMGVQIAIGEGWVDGDEAAAQGWYYNYNDAVVTRAIRAADASTRNDIVCLFVYDTNEGAASGNYATPISISDSGAAYGTAPAANTANVGVIAGTPGAGDPTLPPTAIALARVVVAAGTVQITSGLITDRRQRAGVRGGTVIGTTAQRQAMLGMASGQLAEETDTSRTLVYTGSAWENHNRILQEAHPTISADAGTNVAVGATSADLVSQALTFPVASVVMCSWGAHIWDASNATFAGYVGLYLDGTMKRNVRFHNHALQTNGGAVKFVWYSLAVLVTAGTRTFSVRASNDGTSGGLVTVGDAHLDLVELR